MGCGDGTEDFSQQPLVAPSNLAASNIASQTVRLHWDISPNAFGYNIYMTEAQNKYYTLAGSTATEYYDQKNLTNGTTYSFIVRAFHDTDESPSSNEAESTPDLLIHNPYQTKNEIYKGGIHLHTTNSDGRKTPEEVAAAYKNAGYDFIVIADHDYLTTFLSDPGILCIQGVEETSIGWHILTVNVNGDNKSQDAQVIIDEAYEAGGLAILSHPNWPPVPNIHNKLEVINGYSAIEIYNNFVKENAEDKWDHILSGDNWIYGVASDDMHDFTYEGGFMGGWIRVFADSLTTQDIIDSMETGNYFATTGPELALSITEKTISVATDEPATIEFITVGGQVRKRQYQSIYATYEITGDEMYIRVRITRDSDEKMAWSNPVFIY